MPKLGPKHGQWRYMTRPQLTAMLHKIERDKLLGEIMGKEKATIEQVLEVFEEGAVKFREISREYPGLYVELTGAEKPKASSGTPHTGVRVTIQEYIENGWKHDPNKQGDHAFKQLVHVALRKGIITAKEKTEILLANGFQPRMSMVEAAKMVVRGKGSFKKTLKQFKSAKKKKSKPKKKKR